MAIIMLIKTASDSFPGKTVYFSALLPDRFPAFFKCLTDIVNTSGIPWGLLPYTRDIWCRDYMPVRGASQELVQFQYAPSYLNTLQWRQTITDPSKVCEAIGIMADSVDVVIDGGNVVRFKRKAIMTERIYRENPGYSKEVLLDKLKDVLGVDEIVMIPVEPGDPYGHADGCVRFLNENTVMINEPQKSHPKFDRALRKILEKHRLGFHEMPIFIDHDSKHKDSAVGNYINYLDADGLVVLPCYEGYAHQNERALQAWASCPRGTEPFTWIEATPIAKHGGVLNCVSWDYNGGVYGIGKLFNEAKGSY